MIWKGESRGPEDPNKRRTERKSFTTFTRQTTRARKQKQPQGEGDKGRERHSAFIRNRSPLFSLILAAASSPRQPSPPARRSRKRARSGRPSRAIAYFVPAFVEVKPWGPCCFRFCWGDFYGFVGERLGFGGRESGGGVLGVAEATLLWRFKCCRADGSEGFNCRLGWLAGRVWAFFSPFSFSIWCDFVPLGCASFLGTSHCFPIKLWLFSPIEDRKEWSFGCSTHRHFLFNSTFKGTETAHKWMKNDSTSSLSRCTTFSHCERHANKSVIWGLPENFEQVHETCEIFVA